MATEIGVWQIENGKLERLDTNMVQAGLKETEDLEKWIENNPIVLGNNILIIGEQVQTKSGPLDFLGIDKSGNLIVVELKRDRLPRGALAQAIDYASDVSSWDLDKISEVCLKYSNENLEDYLNEKFEDIDLENLNINENQRILLVGFSLDESLERMIEWLSTNFGISINALILKYIKTKGGEQFIARTMIIPEEIEKERSKKISRKISPPDTTPGTYEPIELKKILESYLSEDRPTPKRIKDILLPLCIDNNIVTREMIKEKLIEVNKDLDEGKAGLILTTISRELTTASRDYLRQIIQYDQTKPWEKDNYRLVEKYKDLVRELIDK